MKISPKRSHSIIDSRHMKIMAAKKQDLKGSVCFLWLDDEKFNEMDSATAEGISEQIKQIEQDVTMFVAPKKYGIELYDLADFKNRDIVITVTCPERNINIKTIERDLAEVFDAAKSVKVVVIDGNRTEISNR